MLKFKATNFNELEEELNERSTELSILTLNAICKAIEEDIDVISLGIMVNLNMDIIVKKEGYLTALERNIDKVAAAEEFELCTKALKYIEILKTENKKED